MRARVVERLDLEGGLRSALERGELHVLYQPQVELASGRIVGAEALLRWQHPDRGLVVPSTFIPIAEQTGLIVDIGAWVLNEACRQAAAWQSHSGRELEMAVNVSPRQLATTEFVGVVEAALETSGLDPALLCLEITESAVLADPEAATQVLERLKAIGVRLAIDDFGLGYSSLSQLKALLPVDTIKIDKSFVDGVTIDGEDHAIVDSVLRLAAGLGLAAVAEGRIERAGGGAARPRLPRLPGLSLRPAAAGGGSRAAPGDRHARRVRRLIATPAAGSGT
jgi:EAL domain-containing protein (putative c-di-GMP-specific phosphodiesterase class I)